MMASIPNMRSTPLPVPAAPGGPAGDAVPGDFAARMPVPAPPIQPGEAVLPAPAAPVALDIDSLPPADAAAGAEDETVDSPEAKTGTPKAETPAQAVVIPFLPVQPAMPGPQRLPTVSADEAAPAPTAEKAVAAPVAAAPRPVREAKGGKPALPVPQVAKSPVEPVAPEDAPAADAARVEAAVKELLQRKQAPTKQVAAAPKAPPTNSSGAGPAPVQAQAQPKVEAKSPAPAPLQLPAAPLPAADQVQPALAPVLPQAAPLKAEAAAAVEGTRTTDLAVERQLDLARDTEWLDRLARDIARAGAADQPLRFRLHPQTLGHLHVELQQGDHGTAVRLTVETEAARQILADAQPRLAAEARAQGVRIAETHVDLSGSGRHAPGDQRRQDEASQTPLIRTARGADAGAVASVRSTGRARLDRYA